MASHNWLEQWCRICAPDPEQRLMKCPKHCTCPKPVLPGLEKFSTFHDVLPKLGIPLPRDFKMAQAEPEERDPGTSELFKNEL